MGESGRHFAMRPWRTASGGTWSSVGVEGDLATAHGALLGPGRHLASPFPQDTLMLMVRRVCLAGLRCSAGDECMWAGAEPSPAEPDCLLSARPGQYEPLFVFLSFLSSSVAASRAAAADRPSV